MKITQIETGPVFTQSRRAVIYAPEAAKPGSLVALSNFLLEKGCNIYPGWDNKHLLRISDFGSDEALHSLLTKEFPQWQAQHRDQIPEPIEIDANILFKSLETNKVVHTFDPIKFMSQNSTSLVGVLSLASGIAMMIATKAKPGMVMEGADKLRQNYKRFASLNFLTAGACLTILDTNQSHVRSMTEILNELDGPLSQEDRARYLRDNRSSVDKLIAFAKRHPWQVATAFNATGSVTLLSSLNPKSDRAETAGVLAGLTALALIAGVLPDNTQSFPGLDDYIDRQTDEQLKDKIKQLDPYRPELSGVARTLGDITANLRSNHMKYAGGVSMLSNIGLTASGLMDKGSKFDKKSMLALLPLNLAADYLTALSNSTFSHNFDTVVSHAAEFIYKKYPEADPLDMVKEAKIISRALALQTEIGHDPFKIQEGILVRLKTYYGISNMPVDPPMELDYTKLIASSPFTQGKYTARIRAEDFAPATSAQMTM